MHDQRLLLWQIQLGGKPGQQLLEPTTICPGPSPVQELPSYTSVQRHTNQVSPLVGWLAVGACHFKRVRVDCVQLPFGLIHLRWAAKAESEELQPLSAQVGGDLFQLSDEPFSATELT